MYAMHYTCMHCAHETLLSAVLGKHVVMVTTFIGAMHSYGAHETAVSAVRQCQWFNSFITDLLVSKS